MRLQFGKWTAIFVLCILLILQLEAAPLDNERPKTALRVKRMTPFWRTMSMRPVGASCRDDTECLTRLCRNQKCCLKTFADK
ncbi:liver-expressed antimicrobial peptide 2 isoform X2 [Hyla sarda]|uniref:liver-expressed antimicrobial peptide 2 isoform X2 n=1 Tax=Hyla sarda TaxID=327740 RepID=UPI0024C2E796|nr:liver-expressed antimicrobial peptide 2 isoform X2 [Hyla sarda]